MSVISRSFGYTLIKAAAKEIKINMLKSGGSEIAF